MKEKQTKRKFEKYFIFALLCGIGLVAAGIFGIVSSRIESSDGKLIPPYDTEKMAGVIYELLKKPEERLRLSNNSRSNLESFSKETILSEWKELIEQFVNLSR